MGKWMGKWMGKIKLFTLLIFNFYITKFAKIKEFKEKRIELLIP